MPPFPPITLRSLNLDRIPFSISAVKIIVEMVKLSSYLEDFSFIDCTTRESLPYISNMIKHNTSLVWLDISRNNLKEPFPPSENGTPAIDSIASALCENNSLKNLIIKDLTFKLREREDSDDELDFTTGNKNGLAEGVEFLNTIIERNHSLNSLLLCHAHFGARVPKHQLETLKSKMEKNSTLQELSIRPSHWNNKISDKIFFELNRNKWNASQRDSRLVDILLKSLNQRELESNGYILINKRAL